MFKTLFITTKPDIVIVSESWVKPTINDNILYFTGYDVFRADRKDRAEGVTMYVSEDLQASLLHFISIPRQFEFLALQITLASSPIIIIGSYRPPSASADAES